MCVALPIVAMAVEVSVNPQHVLGPVKPVNGVGQPPMVGQLNGWPMIRYLKEAGIPYSRLHDVGGWLGRGIYVDIPNLFPDFDADENDPANYRFAYTDSLMKALADNGVEPFYRLGVTIENFADKKGLPPLRIFPPKDFSKWARICEHVIRHYTEGWADGFKMKIDHWEIWNEPEIMPQVELNTMWRAPFSEYVRLYGTAVPYLKKKFPHLKFGGYASCGFYAADGCGSRDAATKPRNVNMVKCFNDFLAAARDGGWPLDFFSYHTYDQPGPGAKQLAYARRTLDEYGFKDTKLICDEWLCDVGQTMLGTARQAAGIAAMLAVFQNGPCDAAMVYDGRCDIGAYSPLFNPLTLKPHRAYYAFCAFNELRRLGTAVDASVTGNGASKTYVLAARAADGKLAAFIVNYAPNSTPLSITGGTGTPRCRIIDEKHVYEEIALPPVLPPYAILLVEWPNAERQCKGRAEWMRGSFGLGVHWTTGTAMEDGSQLPFDEAVERFDVERFADAIKAVGARHCLFTIAHAMQKLPCPNAALDRIDKGRTSKRDLVGEIIKALDRRNIRFIAYYNHSCNGNDKAGLVKEWKLKCGYPCDCDGTGSMETFSSNYCAIVEDLSRRYGKGISAWWFDSPYDIDTTGPQRSCKGEWKFPWASLIAAARSGNESAAVAINAGIGQHFLYSPDTDYHAGESRGKDQKFTPANPDLVDHRWMRADSSYWIFSRELAKKRGFTPLKYSPEELREYVRYHTAAGRMVTFNVLVDQSGKVNPAIMDIANLL